MKTLKFAGKTVIIKAKVTAIDYKLANPKILLKELTVDGEPFSKDHIWVDMTKGLKNLKNGDYVTLRACLSEYIGLDGDKQVKKTGFKMLRIIKKERKC